MTNNSDINRYHSRPLDVHRWSDHPEATKLRDTIWNQYFKEKFLIGGKGNKAKSEPKKQFKILLLDLYVAWLDDPELSIGVGMSKSAYKTNSRYNSLYISPKIIDIINHAHAVGLIDKTTGSQWSGKTTRIRASDFLASTFKQADLSLFDMTQEYPNKEVIVLSKHEFIEDKKKRIEVEYLDTDLESIPAMRQQLHDYNALIWRCHVDIPTLEEPLVEQPYWDKKAQETKIRRVRLTQDNKFVRRVFYRANWNLGGRFHGGWWQNINSDLRKQIYINDRSTVEQDYSGLHVNLLYGLKGIQPPLEDHYEVEHLLLDFSTKEQRKIVKGVVLNAINANNTKSAYAAYRQQQETGSREKSLKDKQLESLLEAFKKKHPKIQESLCSDKGVELMHMDGRITAKVIKHFTNKNIPILSIHDSYITQNQHTSELRKVMNKVVAEELNGFKINIDQEGEGSDQVQAFKNQDRANALDYNYDNVPSYEITEGFKKRYKRHKEWLKKVYQ
jgi:hypothetical protein